MKKPLAIAFVLTSLGTAAPVFAQNILPSGVNLALYGRLDLSVGQEYKTGDKFMANGSGSRLGLRGFYELSDLGKDGKAFFNIEHRFKADTGAQDSSTSFWNGRTVVGLSSADWGELSLGREYSPAYNLSQALSDPWGGDTVAGGGTEYAMLQNKIAKKRYDNSVTYNFAQGPFRFGVQTAERDGLNTRPASFGLGYQDGNIKAGIGYEKNGESSSAGSANLMTIAGSYQMDEWKFLAGLGRGEDKAGKKYQSLQLATTYKIGKGEIRFGVTKLDNTTNDIKMSQQVALGYVHNLNKTVSLYGNVAMDSKRFKGKDEDTAADIGLRVNF